MAYRYLDWLSDLATDHSIRNRFERGDRDAVECNNLIANLNSCFFSVATIKKCANLVVVWLCLRNGFRPGNVRICSGRNPVPGDADGGSRQPKLRKLFYCSFHAVFLRQIFKD